MSNTPWYTHTRATLLALAALTSARAHEDGMLVNEASSCFAGSVRLHPATVLQEGP